MTVMVEDKKMFNDRRLDRDLAANIHVIIRPMYLSTLQHLYTTLIQRLYAILEFSPERIERSLQVRYGGPLQKPCIRKTPPS